jgi:hypothetical protein
MTYEPVMKEVMRERGRNTGVSSEPCVVERSRRMCVILEARSQWGKVFQDWLVDRVGLLPTVRPHSRRKIKWKRCVHGLTGGHFNNADLERQPEINSNRHRISGTVDKAPDQT